MAGRWVAVVSYLLEAGADAAARDKDGRTALHHAAEWGKVECCEALLQKGADPNAKDNDGVTPLMEASRFGRDTWNDNAKDNIEVGRLIVSHANLKITLDVQREDDPKVTIKEEWAQDLHWAIKTTLLKDCSNNTNHFVAIFKPHLADVLQDVFEKGNWKPRLDIDEASVFVRATLLALDSLDDNPFISDVVFSQESRTLIEQQLQYFIKHSENPLVDLCWMKAAFLRRAKMRPMVADDLKGICNTLSQYISSGFAMPEMDNPETVLEVWGCKCSEEILQNEVIQQMLDSKDMETFSLPQIQNHIQLTFYKIRGDDPEKDRWCVQDWRMYPFCFFVTSLFLHISYLVLTVKVVWSEENFHLDTPTQIFLFLMTIGYVFEEIAQFVTKKVHYLTKDIWNALDLLLIFSYFSWVATSELSYLSLNLFVVPFRIMHYLSVSKSTGSFTTVLMRMVFDTANFLLSFSVILFGYALMCSSLLQSTDGFGTFKTSLLTLFSAALGDFSLDIFLNDDGTYQWSGLVVMVLFLLLAMVMALNMLIAVLSDTYARLAENQHPEWCLVFGSIVAESQVREQWPHSLKLPAPLSLITHILYPLVWLYETHRLAWSAHAVCTIIFILDLAVHFTLGLPILLVTLVPVSCEVLKEEFGFNGFRYYLFLPFFHLFFVIFTWSYLVPMNSFDKYKDLLPRKQSQYAEGLITSNPVHDGIEEEKGDILDVDAAGAGEKDEPIFMRNMRKALAECQVTEISKLEKKLETKLAELAEDISKLEKRLIDEIKESFKSHSSH